MANRGYHFFVGELELPYAPSELKVTVGSNNETVNLISGNDISILKSPKLREIKFDIDLPRGRQYPFANTVVPPKTYIDYFNKLLADKTPTELMIIRDDSSSGRPVKHFESTKLTVSLEGYDWVESAENGYDMTVSLKFKEYIKHGTVTIKKTTTKKATTTKKPTTKKTTAKSKTKTVSKNKTHTVKTGDTLWGIARKYYGDGTKWKKIYTANKKVIEKVAKQRGLKSSSNGHWIFTGTKLTIPAK